MRERNMPSIAIVDDRKDKRETMFRVVSSTLKKMKQADDWKVVADEPPSNERDVLHWLDENDATVLVSDWKLNEGAKSKRVVNYEADSLIKEIRARRPNFPIFVVTGFEAEAHGSLKDVENIFSRDHFTKNVDTILPQMLRAGRRRYDEQRELLKSMDSLARKVAAGSASDKEHGELKSLHGYFQAELPTIISLDGVLTDFEKVKERANALRQKVQSRIRQEKRKK
jgi:CheY-like chemotaxis protein